MGPHLNVYGEHLKEECASISTHDLFQEHYRQEIQAIIELVNAQGGYVKHNGRLGDHRILPRKEEK